MTFHFNNDLYVITEFLHVKPGKGPAFVRTKLKSITTGKVLDNTFPSGSKVEEVRIERRPYQFLYKDEQGYHFMHNETYEQIFIQEALINGAPFLKDGQMCEVSKLWKKYFLRYEKLYVKSCQKPELNKKP